MYIVIACFMNKIALRIGYDFRFSLFLRPALRAIADRSDYVKCLFYDSTYVLCGVVVFLAVFSSFVFREGKERGASSVHFSHVRVVEVLLMH